METPTKAIRTDEFSSMAEEWIADAICRQHSQQTLDSRRLIVNKFLWWLREERLLSIGVKEIRSFLIYVGSTAPPGGRWGNPAQVRCNSARTVNTYWERLKTLFSWGVREGTIAVSPMINIRPPASRHDQIQPFNHQQIHSLLEAADRSSDKLRDTAICLFLLDTGVRATELCTLQAKDLDLANGQARVLGKGNKRRTVYIDEITQKALGAYLDIEPRGLADPVFRGARGHSLTRSGLTQLVHRLGKAASLTCVRCSPHTLRHTSAIWSILNGMNAFSLQTMLGHTDLTMTRRYVAFAEADLKEQHRRCSPVRHMTPECNSLPA